MSTWVRPESLQFPCKYKTFNGLKAINGKIPKFWIQEITEDFVEPVVNHMVSGFLCSEPICKHAKVYEDPVSVAELREGWTAVLTQKVGLICLMETNDGKPIIAGMNLTTVWAKNKKTPDNKGEAVKKLVRAIRFVEKQNDAYEKFGVAIVLSAMGLYVLPTFRGQGIGDELLKARIPLCKSLGIKVTTTVFTSFISQKIAARVGFQELYSIDYDDLEKIHPDMKYPGITEHSKSIKYMYLKIE